MSIPKEHKKHYKDVVEERLQERQEGIKRLKKSLRLLEGKRIEPEYTVVMVAKFKNYSGFEDEKDISYTAVGDIKSVIKEAEKKFMYENRTNQIGAHYTVGLVVGDVTLALPAKLWGRLKRRCR